MDEQYWKAEQCDPRKPCWASCPGPKAGEICYYDIDIEGDATVLHIIAEAQKNVTELGYWRDVATGLSSLVDKLCARVRQLQAKAVEAQLGKGVQDAI